MKIKQRLILIAYFLLVPVLLWAGPMITGQGGGGGSMTYPGVGVGLSTGAAWDTSLAVGTDLQAWDTILDSIAATTPVNQGILSYLTVGGYDWRTTHQHDDSAAQFNSATASKGTLKFDQTGITNGKLVTVKYTSADNYTFTPTITGNTGVTYPTSGTLIGHDGTDANLGAVNLLTTGYLYGGLKGFLLAADSTVATSRAYGAVWYMATSSVLTLPTGAPGMTIAMRTTTATNPVIKPASTGVISNAGTNYTAGSGIKNTSATIGNYITLHNLEGTTWYVWGSSGTWTQGDI